MYLEVVVSLIYRTQPLRRFFHALVDERDTIVYLLTHGTIVNSRGLQNVQQALALEIDGKIFGLFSFWTKSAVFSTEDAELTGTLLLKLLQMREVADCSIVRHRRTARIESQIHLACSEISVELTDAPGVSATTTVTAERHGDTLRSGVFALSVDVNSATISFGDNQTVFVSGFVPLDRVSVRHSSSLAL